MAIIKKKYGDADSEGNKGRAIMAEPTLSLEELYEKARARDRQVIKQGDRNVATECNKGRGYLSITYLDSKLAELAENERIALERSKAIEEFIEFIIFILSIIFFAISTIICWRVDREKCKTLKIYLAKILIGVAAFSFSIACVIGLMIGYRYVNEVPFIILGIIFFAISAIICWRVDREKCKTLEEYLAKILVGVVAFSISIASVIGLIMAL